MVKEGQAIKFKRLILEYRGVVLTVLAMLLIFLIGVIIYKHFNPFALPGIERRTLFVLVSLGLLTLALYFPYSWAASKLKSLRVRWVPSTLQPLLDWAAAKPGNIGARIDIAHLISKGISIIFLTLLVLLVLEPIFGWGFLQNYQTALIVATIGIGALALWLNRDRINLKAETKREDLGEAERKKRFGGTFPKINKIPVLSWLVRWMYKEGWVYSIGLVLLITVGLGLRLWNLGVPSFGDDELITAYAAKGFADTGNFILPSGFIYNNYWLDLFSRACSIKLFGFNEFGARLPSAIFGSLTIGLAYLVGKELGGKKAGLISAFIICFLPWEVSWSREARMYSTLQMFYLGLTYTTYLALVKYRKLKWYILSLILLIATFAVHTLGIVFLAVPYFYLLLNSLEERKLRRCFFVILSGAFIIIPVFFLYAKLPPNLTIVIEPFYKTGYFASYLLTNYALFATAGILLMTYLLLSKDKLGSLVAISFISSFAIISYLLGWKQSKYIYHLLPLLVVTSSVVFVYIKNLCVYVFRTKHANLLFLIILVAFLFAVIPFPYTLQIPQANIKDRAEITVFDAMVHPDWRGLAKDFSYLIEEETVVISTHPLASLYYFGTTAYSLRRGEAMLDFYVYLDDEKKFRSIQTGSIWVKDYAEFISIVENSDVFLIVDHRFSRHYVTKDVRDYVSEEGTLIGSKGELKIYFLQQISGD